MISAASRPLQFQELGFPFPAPCDSQASTGEKVRQDASLGANIHHPAFLLRSFWPTIGRGSSSTPKTPWARLGCSVLHRLARRRPSSRAGSPVPSSRTPASRRAAARGASPGRA